jgi:hypothetical protein
VGLKYESFQMYNVNNDNSNCAACLRRQQMGNNPPVASSYPVRAAFRRLIEARREHERRAYSPDAIAGLLAACRKLPGFVFDELHRKGIRRTALKKLSVRQGNIVEVSSNRFEFEVLCRSCWGRESKPAILMPVYDLQGDLVDLAAWDPETNRVSTWRGLAWALGQDTVFAGRLSEGLLVHRTPLDWLRADCKGVVILNPSVARGYLVDAGPLIAEDAKHRRELAVILTQPLPRILVPSATASREG